MVSTISKANESNQSPEPEITLEEFLKLPETKPASEYIDGKIYQKLMPQEEHSLLQGQLTSKINEVGIPNKLVYAFPELRCGFGGRLIVPDIVVLEWANIPRQENGRIMNTTKIVPDWVIEILSPDQRVNKVIEKIIFALENGTKLGWLVDPEKELVIIFHSDQIPEIKSGNDKLPAIGVTNQWQLSAAELFNYLYIDL